MIAESNASKSLLAELKTLSRFNFRLFVTGESGTGKDLLARHYASLRGKSFHYVNCATLRGDLAASQLFGHVKGAFTGAASASVGLLEAANGGVLLLDEVACLPMDIQTQLLSCLQNREVYPLGSRVARPISCEIVAATCEDVASLVSQKLFRADLYSRLAEYELHILPLRERVADIQPIARGFLEQLNSEYQLAVRLPMQFFISLETLPLTGNAREVQSLVRAAFVRAVMESEQSAASGAGVLASVSSTPVSCMGCESLDALPFVDADGEQWQLCDNCQAALV